MPRPQLSDATSWITEAALLHPADLPAAVAARLGISTRSASALLSKLVDAQWLLREGTRRPARYRPGAMRQVVRHYALDGLEEDLPWQRDFAPCMDLPRPVARMVQHAFTELLNNAIVHSGGRLVTVSLRQTPLQVQLLVSDDGRGVFDVINETFAIPDPTLAMMELAKGKLTTQPDRHTGRGLFFTARLADVFDLHANQAAFQRRDWQRDVWHRSRPACQQGSSVYVAIRLDTTRTLDQVLHEHSLDGLGYGFDSTVVPLALITSPEVGLESRAQARRVAARLLQFRRVALDFNGLDEVGHAFADELFRVIGGQNPVVQLVPVNMSPRVAALIDSVREQVAA